MITQRATVLVLSMMTVVVTLLPTSTTSFLLSPPPSSWSSLQMATQPATADFEYQELKIQLSAMKEQDVVTSRLASSKRNELEGYVKRILNRRTVASSKSIPLYEIGDFLPNTKWRLIFSTQSLTSELPKDAKIQLEFVDNGKLDYILEFSKTLGLKRLVAKSSYTVDSSPVNPGLVTYEYDSISTDVFGLSNINVGLFGLMKGRSNYINTRFFDDSLWIETGVEPSGMEYYNVYMKDE